MKIIVTQLQDLPEIKLTHNVPVFNEEDYRRRFKDLASLMEMFGYEHIIIYGDREHFSNIFFLTGFEPRFEEALLIFSLEKCSPLLLVGNEGLMFSCIIPFEINKELYHDFSLIGQPKMKNTNLEKIFSDIGIKNNSKVGVIGWKYYPETETPEKKIDIPFYIVKTLIDLVGFYNLKNATDIMLHPEYGLRSKADLKELVLHEIAGTKTSQGVFNLLQNLHPRMTEMEASRYLQIDGEPLIAFPNVNFGIENTLLGLASPTYSKILKKGEIVNVAFGYRRAMVARTGLFVDNWNEIPPSMEGIVENLYIPYFKALVNWYETIGIGVTGGEVYHAVKDMIGDFNKFGINLNPGHLTHIDEWTNSIFYENSNYKISSGMIIQCDIIAFPGFPYGGVHVEDGILIADQQLRDDIKNFFPDSWDRIIKRKRFLKEKLGINLKEEVLPTSNIQAVLFPFMGNTSLILCRS